MKTILRATFLLLIITFSCVGTFIIPSRAHAINLVGVTSDDCVQEGVLINLNTIKDKTRAKYNITATCVKDLTFIQYYHVFIDQLIPLILFFALIMIMGSALQYMLAGVNPEGQKAAKQRVMGILIGALFFVLMNLILDQLGNQIQLEPTTQATLDVGQTGGPGRYTISTTPATTQRNSNTAYASTGPSAQMRLGPNTQLTLGEGTMQTIVNEDDSNALVTLDTTKPLRIFQGKATLLGGAKVKIDQNPPLSVTPDAIIKDDGNRLPVEQFTIRVNGYEKIPTDGVFSIFGGEGDYDISATPKGQINHIVFKPCSKHLTRISGDQTLTFKMVAATNSGDCEITYGDAVGDSPPAVATCTPGTATISADINYLTFVGSGPTTGNDILWPIPLSIDGAAKSLNSDGDFRLNHPGCHTISTPQVTVNTDASNGNITYRACTTQATYVPGNDILKVRLIPSTAPEGETCYASFEKEGQSSQLNIHLIALDTKEWLSPNAHSLTGVRLSIVDEITNDYQLKVETGRTPGDTFHLDIHGVQYFKAEKPGYRMCEESYDFQYSGDFTIQLTPLDKPLPANSAGGIDDHPRCHYTPE